MALTLLLGELGGLITTPLTAFLTTVTRFTHSSRRALDKSTTYVVHKDTYSSRAC
jgi:hypothetical protein